MAIKLEISGRHALLFDDDANAAFVNSSEALVPFNGDNSLLIDRFDVRHLLDRIPPRSKNKNHRFVEDTGGDVSQSDLDRERFLDLPDEEEEDEEVDDCDRVTTERSEAKGSSTYQAVPFSYGNNKGSADENGSESNRSVFHPPFPVPADLLNNLPPTEKLHQIMARTAIFVSEHGGQSEIVLRVKQGDNPTFGFLMPDNELHPYFRFLVKHPQLLNSDTVQEEKKSDEEGALSLLGSMYGTGEDDENASQQESNKESHKSGKEESSSEKEPIKQSVASSKERTILPKKNHFINPASISKKKEVNTLKLDKKIDAKPPLLEPPSFLKRNIEKVVEFIQKNGREFETKLIDQDKTAGQFPFLLASNLYHPYYLKVLEEGPESKSASNESVPDELLDDLPFNPHKKEKFTMLIGNSKREIIDQPSKPVRQSGVTTDEAAAIVLAATRGRSPFPNTSTNDSDTKSFSLPNGKVSDANSNETDSSEATLTKEQKLKAERLKRAKLFAAMIKSGAQPIKTATETKHEVFDEASVKGRNYRKRNNEEEESDEDHKHSEKKHRSKDKESKHHHHHHHSRSYHHHKHKHYSDESEDDDEHIKRHRRHRSHKDHSDSEDEDRHEKSSRHKSRHRKHELSEDEDRDRSHKHRRKHRSPSEKREELEEGELCEEAAIVSDVKASDATTEVPSDLRAKIRAMLLETL